MIFMNNIIVTGIVICILIVITIRVLINGHKKRKATGKVAFQIRLLNCSKNIKKNQGGRVNE